MLGSAQPTRFQPFDERMAREQNRGLVPYIDLVEHSEGASHDLLIVGDEAAPKKRGRRPQYTQADIEAE